MSPDSVRKALQVYGYEAREVMPIQKGYRNESHPICLNSGRMVNLILYKDEPDILVTIKQLNETSLFLHEHGFPARHALDARILRVHGRTIRYASLYDYLPGDTISWNGYTRKHLKLLGQSMSDMHAELRRMPSISSLPRITEQYTLLVARIESYFTNESVRRALATKLNLTASNRVFSSLTALLVGCSSLPEQQTLHMDFVRSNILFSNDHSPLAICGVLDFEKVATGHPIFDIARTLAFLQVDCVYTAPHRIIKYFLLSGYQKYGANHVPTRMYMTTAESRSLLERLVDLFLMHDFYKFLLHNPYEALSENHHFLRTRNELMQRGIISTAFTA
jgi:Ser/Thr protein kinase RdoA (MazF antagonist)